MGEWEKWIAFGASCSTSSGPRASEAPEGWCQGRRHPLGGHSKANEAIEISIQTRVARLPGAIGLPQERCPRGVRGRPD
eukprot:2757778-Pyramimonas_sp.AAC.1